MDAIDVKDILDGNWVVCPMAPGPVLLCHHRPTRTERVLHSPREQDLRALSDVAERTWVRMRDIPDFI